MPQKPRNGRSKWLCKGLNSVSTWYSFMSTLGTHIMPTQCGQDFFDNDYCLWCEKRGHLSGGGAFLFTLMSPTFVYPVSPPAIATPSTQKKASTRLPSPHTVCSLHDSMSGNGGQVFGNGGQEARPLHNSCQILIR